MREAFEREFVVGWKGIAGFLDCSIDTAQRYWREKGLPVRELGNKIIAGKCELNEWVMENAALKKEP